MNKQTNSECMNEWIYIDKCLRLNKFKKCKFELIDLFYEPTCLECVINVY